MSIFIGSDHAGFELKKFLSEQLTSKGYRIVDCGPYTLVPDDDYPEYVSKVANAVATSLTPSTTRGIVLGYSGQGEAVVANKIARIRAAVFYGGPLDIVKLSRQHNNSNILSLGAHFLTPEEALTAVTTWLETAFSNEPRHIRRNKEVDAL